MTELMPVQNKPRVGQSTWRIILDKINRWFGWSREQGTVPTNADVTAIAMDAVLANNSLDFLSAFAATTDPAERERLKAGWEKRIAERKASLAENVSATPRR